MSPEEFIQEIKSPRRRPVYLLSGEEPAALKRCLAAAEQAVDPGFLDFNFQSLSVDEGGGARLAAEASTMPLMGPPRIVIGKAPALNAADQEALLEYLKKPNELASLILVTAKPDSRLRLFKRLAADGAEVACQPPKGQALLAWVADELKNRGVTAAPGVPGLLVERAGQDLGALLGEVEKLSLYVGEGGRLDAETVRRLVSLAPNANVFELGEALAARNPKAGLAVLLDLLGREHHLPVLAMVVRHFRILLKIKTRQAELDVSQLPESEARHLGLHPYVLKKSQVQTRLWNWKELTEALAALEDAHRALVTSSAPPNIIMEHLALKLGCG